MARDKTIYVCNSCGNESLKWLGKCPGCGDWNTLQEQIEREVAEVKNRFVGLVETQPVTSLSEIADAALVRTPSGSEELDRVLGGGFVMGGVVLIAGEPGFGKSTLLLQTAEQISRTSPVLYVSGEESGGQVAMRARRLGLDCKSIRFLGEISLEKILHAVQKETPSFLVIDSIQTMYSEALSSAPGSVTQVRECASKLVRVAKTSGIAVALVGHITKDGSIAGPRVLQHAVDAVLEGEGDQVTPLRLLRATKNRFGALELGVFAMAQNGMRGVSNPSAIFMLAHNRPVPGSIIAATMEGSRPMLVELQALVAPGGASPRRLSVGLDRDRLAMLLAVLARHAAVSCHDQDVFINAVGGLQLDEPATDLAVVLAIFSSMRDKPLPRGLVVLGEVGLVGEVRPSPRGMERLKEAARLGMAIAIVPKPNVPKKAIDGLTVVGVERVDEALQAVKDLEQ